MLWHVRYAASRSQHRNAHFVFFSLGRATFSCCLSFSPSVSAMCCVLRMIILYIEDGCPWNCSFSSSQSALIEAIPDAYSVHTLKSQLPNGATLKDHFVSKFGTDTPASRNAQRNFAESLAGYSLVSHFLQLKDRHNGNLLLDKEGHIIHIDFSFMLSHSPGGINLEFSPFKLTREMLEALDSDSEGSMSNAFSYYKVLVIQGFLALRKYSERILFQPRHIDSKVGATKCTCLRTRSCDEAIWRAVGGLIRTPPKGRRDKRARYGNLKRWYSGTGTPTLPHAKL